MNDLLMSAAVLAAESPGPRGDNPDGGNGILIILAIVAIVAIAGFLIHAMFHRYGRSRGRAFESHPAPPGRVGRTSEFRQDG